MNTADFDWWLTFCRDSTTEVRDARVIGKVHRTLHLVADLLHDSDPSIQAKVAESLEVLALRDAEAVRRGEFQYVPPAQTRKAA